MTTDDVRERLVARLLAERGTRLPAGPRIPRRPDGAAIPLSGAQRGLWFTERLGLDRGAYVMPHALRLTGRLDVDALRAALRAVVARHEALRAYIVDNDGVPEQRIAAAAPIDLSIVDVGSSIVDTRRLAAAEVDRPFDLDTPPLLRATLYRLAGDDHVLLLCVHHIVCDDDSLNLLVDETARGYAAAPTGRPSELPELAVHYPDFVLWQAQRLDAGERDRQLGFWIDRLAGLPAALELPTDRPRRAQRTTAGASHPFTVPAGVATPFTALVRAHGCTEFAGLLAAFGALLARHGGGTDLVIGSPTSTRALSDVDSVVGMFVNPTALRLDLAGDPTVAELLDRARLAVIEALGHADVPFDHVAAAVAGRRDLAVHPVFQVMLVQGRAGQPASWPGLAARPFRITRATSRFDLTWNVQVTGGDWPAIIDYSTDLFDADTIARLAERLTATMAAMLPGGRTRLSDLDIAAGADRDAVAALNDTRRDYAEPGLVPELIAAQAARTPDAVAVLALDERGDRAAELSFGELDGRANRLAVVLRELGVGPDGPVGMALRAGPDAIVAILGILRAGGCYVPLDPGHPPQRLAAVLADCGAPVLIAAPGVPGPVAGPGDVGRFGGYRGVVLDTGHEAFRQSAPAPPAADPHPARLAYVIYTSGSTGRPKGVAVQHDTLLNLTRAFIEHHGIAAGHRLLMVPPLSFDAAVGDVFPALVAGAALVVHPEPAALDGPQLLRLCREHAITTVDTAAALWRRWVEDLSGGEADVGPLSVMMVGGEAVPAATVHEWAALTAGRVALFNHYGPTEATVCATSYRTVDGAGLDPQAASVPIGRPLPNVRAYVLDADLRPVPLGVPGELYIGGAAPARGYHGAPALTAAAFVPDAYSPVPGGRLYRTGDVVKLRGDGQLEYLGRADDQVKVRGNRIELGEVRARLVAHPQIADAAVLARDQALIGYVVPRGRDGLPDADGLRAFCAQRLPDYMVPSAFVTLDALPRNRHGKLDAAALPVPERAGHRPYEPPRTPVEHTLAGIWAEVLGVARVGRHDSFFDLGGHSLLAAPVLARLRAVLGVTLPLRALFTTADLAELAGVVEQARTATDEVFARTYTAGLPSVSRLRADAVPPDDIAPAGPAVTTSPRHVLLIGGTGFLGAHLLAELLARTTARVHCLVRAPSPAAATDRLVANLRRAHRGLDAEALARIVPVPGDMAQPRLGLAGGDYEELCDRIDAIYHNGAAMNFVQSYDVLLPPHVRSTVEVLRLATRRRTKPVHLSSTLGVYLGTAYDGRQIRETDPADDPEGLDSGYHTTKWVADRLAVHARDRGLPISIYRIAAIVGDVRTGTAKTDSYLSRQVSTCAHLGAVPRTGEVIDMVPVDAVAAAIAALSTRDDRHGRDFHFYRADGFRYADLGTVLTDAGFPTAVLPYPQWRSRMLDAPDSAFGPLAFGLSTWRRAHPVFDCTATWRAAAECGVTFPRADATMMRRHVEFLAAAGALPHRSEVS